MCRVRTRSKREASSQNLTRKTSHMLNIPYNFLNGFELISKVTCGTSQSAEIRRLAEKSHVWIFTNLYSSYKLCIHTTQLYIRGMIILQHRKWMAFYMYKCILPLNNTHTHTHTHTQIHSMICISSIHSNIYMNVIDNAIKYTKFHQQVF